MKANESPESTVHGPQSVVIWMEPVHPQCRIFDCRRIHQYAEKLKAAGEAAALTQLAQAIKAATYQPIYPTRLEYCRN